MAKKKAYRFVVYVLCRILVVLISFLPRSMLLGIARGVAIIGFKGVRKQRESTLKNLNKVFSSDKSSQEIEGIAKDVFKNLALTAVDIVKLRRWKNEKILDIVDVGDAFEIYKKELAKGRGIISVTAHFGNWELLAGMFGMHGFDGAVLARRIYYERYNQWVVAARQAMNVRTIYRDQSSREILRLLKEGQLIGLVPDQDIDSLKGVFMDFFDLPAYTTVAPARLAIASGAPIICSFLVRRDDGSYKIEIESVIHPDSNQDRDVAVREITKAWMQSIENIIRKYPGQWAWMHDRWKTTPENIEKSEGAMAQNAAQSITR